MAIERRWGYSIWFWRALAVSAVLSVLLLLFSLTETGRIFAVMLLIAEAFTAFACYFGWARTERARFETELRAPSDDVGPF